MNHGKISIIMANIFQPEPLYSFLPNVLTAYPPPHRRPPPIDYSRSRLDLR